MHMLCVKMMFVPVLFEGLLPTATVSEWRYGVGRSAMLPTSTCLSRWPPDAVLGGAGHPSSFAIRSRDLTFAKPILQMTMYVAQEVHWKCRTGFRMGSRMVRYGSRRLGSVGMARAGSVAAARAGRAGGPSRWNAPMQRRATSHPQPRTMPARLLHSYPEPTPRPTPKMIL